MLEWMIMDDFINKTVKATVGIMGVIVRFLDEVLRDMIPGGTSAILQASG
ncbi:MAG: hypothetical protein DDT42_00265 [candidate division WS2 bacterium]|uniref:Uncharacterized protein n=1 Tax=Psychracetigena formicireducens TaxID=2986056 RepID=A0A9E2BG79_PSYF1|nr:hypothetical protein [Candidatus Psychracetigena formicireducens]MBT9144424.1 hypothetical protein [Candidatus Psychracetigena formicireducens]